ncbi:MAG: hypothetical protein RSF40_05940 [Oscillospiraceae bacterium]
MNNQQESKKSLVLSIIGLIIICIGIIVNCVMEWYAGLLIMLPLTIPHIYQISLYCKHLKETKTK